MVLFHIITSFTKIFHMISMNFMQTWQNHSRASLAPPKLPSKTAPLLAIVFGPRNSRHKTPVTKLYLQKNLRTNIKSIKKSQIRSSKPALFPAWPQWNHHWRFVFSKHNIQKNMGNSLNSPFAPSHGGPPRKFRKRQWVWLRVHWPFPPSEASWRWLQIPMMFQSPNVFPPIFRCFFFRPLRFGRIQVLLIETSMCFSFFGGDPLKHTKRRRKKTCVLKKHMYVNTNGQALGESESSESCQESAMWY